MSSAKRATYSSRGVCRPNGATHPHGEPAPAPQTTIGCTTYVCDAVYELPIAVATQYSKAEQFKVAAWMNARFESNSAALGRVFGRPSSTMWGWIRQFKRLPLEQRQAVLTDCDKNFLK